MSNRYKGGIISATPPTTTGGETGVASGAWTLEQQMQAQAAGNWPIQPPPVYIEDVFSTWLYTGTGAAQTITNGINLSGKGGLVWTKSRNTADDSRLFDTVSNSILSSSLTLAKLNGGNPLVPTYVTFNNNGFTTPNDFGGWNTNGTTYASWTFREQPKFFDCVTYTGNGTNQTLNHNLGAVPGCMIVKATSASGAWYVYHRSAEFPGFGASGSALILNSSAAVAGSGQYWAFTSPTATQFTVGAFSGESILTNIAGVQYVAYLFAHNAGGFGPTETDNVISCGSFTSNGNGAASVNLGYEPQWIMYKDTTNTGEGWIMIDNMRGFLATGGLSAFLRANTSAAEVANALLMGLNSTGFSSANNQFAPNTPYVYIAIRRGPMATPTTGTSVFSPNTTNDDTVPITTNFPVDMFIGAWRTGTYRKYLYDRLRGDGFQLQTTSTDAELAAGITNQFTSNVSVTPGQLGAGTPSVVWNFRRAPGFFDEVCYTGTGSATTVAHNLAAVPELIITKCRGDAFGWAVYSSAVGNTAALFLETTAVPDTNSAYWNNTTPTSTVFTVGSANRTNRTSLGMVAYLFASCPGVSKVGSYTGTGTTQVINCGFTGGARFVMIKRTDSTGDWYVWDTARGMIPANDPYLLLNSTAAEVTGTDFVDTAATGFEITSTAPAAINANGGTFIFLAVA